MHHRQECSGGSSAHSIELHTRTTIANRRRSRSFKTLFLVRPPTGQQHHFESPQASPSLSIGSINEDVLREIADQLAPSDLLNLSLASSQLRALLVPALYDTVVLKSSRSCRKTLSMLQDNRHLCRYIRKLAVRPNYYLAWPYQDTTLDEAWVVDQLLDLCENMTILSVFDWDGLELPEDRLWEGFQRKCPTVKSIFANVGSQPLDPESALWTFSDLTAFSLVVRHGIPGSELFPTPEPLPPAFWDMILRRSPNLEELAICTFSSSARLLDFDRAVEGDWPKLHSLTLGSFGYQEDFTLGPARCIGDEGTLTDFLARHRRIKYIRFLWNFKRWMSPATIGMGGAFAEKDMIGDAAADSDDPTTTTALAPLSDASSSVPALSPDALPVLEAYAGIYQQLMDMPNPGKVESVDLTCEPVYESRVGDVCRALGRLHNLTSLDLWAHIAVTATKDHTPFFRALVGACPKLTDLHLMCTTSFAVKPLKQLIAQLRGLPHLKRFSLTKGHKYLADESMLDTAVRVFKHLPTVKQVNIRWARESCPNHLKQEGSYDLVGVDSATGGTLSRTIPAGLRASRASGTKLTIAVVERGIPLVGPAFRRRYTHTTTISSDATMRRRNAVHSTDEESDATPQVSVGASLRRGSTAVNATLRKRVRSFWAAD